MESSYVRGPWFDSLRLNPRAANSVSERNLKKHQHIRTILSAGLSGKDIRGLEHTVNLHVQKLSRMLQEGTLSRETGERVVDLSKIMPFFSMDVISHLCLGKSLGRLDINSDCYGLIEALSGGMIVQPYIATLLEVKDFIFCLDKIPFLRGKCFPNEWQNTGIGKLVQVTFTMYKVETNAINF